MFPTSPPHKRQNMLSVQALENDTYSRSVFCSDQGDDIIVCPKLCQIALRCDLEGSRV